MITKEWIENQINMLEIEYPPVKMTTNNVYGKEILIVDYKTMETRHYQIENWYIVIPLKSWYDANTILDIIKEEIKMEEYSHCNELGCRYDEITEYCLIKDWKVLRLDENRITLVKYAKVLENLEVEE